MNDIQLRGIHKILVIQLGPFGDVLLTTSYFEALKNKLPWTKIYFLVKEPYDLAIRDHSLINCIMVIPLRSGLGYALERVRTVLRIRKEHFDLVIDQQLKPSSQQLTFLSGARYRLGYREGRLAGTYNLKASLGEPVYSASGKFDLLRPLGIDLVPYRLYFPIPEAAERYVDYWLRSESLAGAGVARERLVCVSPGSPVESKRWNPASYARLADFIQRGSRNRVILLWGPGEEADAARVRCLMETEPVMAPPTDLRQAAAFDKVREILAAGAPGGGAPSGGAPVESERNGGIL